MSCFSDLFRIIFQVFSSPFPDFVFLLVHLLKPLSFTMKSLHGPSFKRLHKCFFFPWTSWLLWIISYRLFRLRRRLLSHCNNLGFKHWCDIGGVMSRCLSVVSVTSVYVAWLSARDMLCGMVIERIRCLYDLTIIAQTSWRLLLTGEREVIL